MPQKSTAGTSIGQMLLREGLITGAQLDDAVQRQKETKTSLVRLLIDSGALDETKRLNFFKKHFGIPVVSLVGSTIDPAIVTYLPEPIARRNRIVPLKLDRDGLVLAMEDPSNFVLLEELHELTGLRIKPVLALSEEIEEALEAYSKPSLPVVEEARAEQPDWVIRGLAMLFLPLTSILALLAIAALIVFHSGFQSWLQNHFADSGSSARFTVFLYFFLTWGVFTIVMFEVQGLLLQDFSFAPDTKKPSRSRGKALLLAILLGWLGMDRLYLGYAQIGILKFLTLGLVGIWWVLDIVAIATNRVPDVSGRRLA